MTNKNITQMRTPIENLIEKLQENGYISKFPHKFQLEFKRELDSIIAEQKELEKDAIIEAFQSGSDDGCCMKSIQAGTDYYNHKFEKHP